MKESLNDPFEHAPIYSITPQPEFPAIYVGEETRRRMRNDKKHRLTCAKNRKSRKKKRLKK